MKLQDPKSLARSLFFISMAINEASLQEKFTLKKILRYANQYSDGSLKEKEIMEVLETPLIDLIRVIDGKEPKSEYEITHKERGRIVQELKKEFKNDGIILTRAVAAACRS